MTHVSVTIAGRAFRMACEDGQEEHLSALARQIDEKIAQMRSAFGEIGDNRLTVMAAITVADDLSEANRTIAALRQQIGALEAARDAAQARADALVEITAQAVEAAAVRLEDMVGGMNADGRRAVASRSND